ncbi:hypothetical protein EYF80_042310 [Liparis tanakae]|uniref:Uncharacterized protein n=1 Tax=Liparis tanakae TaxID=230148 RepID=A0A4Z2G1Q8_9TELE|nr:hypothetical protein EYF80_042310 [Liparis tanakae]
MLQQHKRYVSTVYTKNTTDPTATEQLPAPASVVTPPEDKTAIKNKQQQRLRLGKGYLAPVLVDGPAVGRVDAAAVPVDPLHQPVVPGPSGRVQTGQEAALKGEEPVHADGSHLELGAAVADLVDVGQRAVVLRPRLGQAELLHLLELHLVAERGTTGQVGVKGDEAEHRGRLVLPQGANQQPPSEELFFLRLTEGKQLKPGDAARRIVSVRPIGSHDEAPMKDV